MNEKVTWVAHSFWMRAREVTNRDLDPGYRVDMLISMRFRKFDAGFVRSHAQRWADNMADAVQGEFEAANNA